MRVLHFEKIPSDAASQPLLHALPAGAGVPGRAGPRRRAHHARGRARPIQWRVLLRAAGFQHGRPPRSPERRSDFAAGRPVQRQRERMRADRAQGGARSQHVDDPAGARRVRGRYLPTPKNGQVADFYERHGFEAAEADGETTATIASAEPAPPHITINR